MAKRGRPRALVLNPVAVEERLRHVQLTRAKASTEAGISHGQFLDALNENRCKGIPEEKIRKLADVLQCEPETIAPELLRRFRSVRPADPDEPTVDLAEAS